MRTDCELIELAAKAAGITIQWSESWGCYKRDARPVAAGYSEWVLWRPIADDGDAHRLAALLELDVVHRVVGGRRIEVLAAGGPLIKHFYEGDIAAAMRRSITLAAAEIGAMSAKQEGGHVD